MPASGRRKRVVQSSDSEGPAVPLGTSQTDSSKKQHDAGISSDVGSESEVVLSQSAKRQKLEAQRAPHVLGEFSCIDVMGPYLQH